MSSFENFVRCRVVSPLAADTTSFALYAAEGPYRLPPETGGVLVLTDSPHNPSVLEIIEYGYRTDLGLYDVLRGQEGTVPVNWTGPVYCYQALMAGTFQDVIDSKADKIVTEQTLGTHTQLLDDLNPLLLPNIRPSLPLDFIRNKRLDPRITFTRASGGGRFNASGQYEWLPANVPRIDYDPVTGECLGLLVEEQRTNLFRLDASLVNTARLTVTTADANSPLGRPAKQVMTTTTTEIHYFGTGTYGMPESSGGVFSAHGYFKADGYNYLRIDFYTNTNSGAVFDLGSGTLVSKSASISATTIKPMPDGWFYCSATITVPSGQSGPAQGNFWVVSSPSAQAFAGDPAKGLMVDGIQFEAGSPSSYIPTTDAQVTRAADVASVNTLSPWYNPEQGTLFVEYIQGMTPLSAGNRVLELYAGAPSNQSALRVYEFTDGGRAVLSMDGLDSTLVMPPVAGYLTKHKMATTYTAGTISASRDGSVAKSGAHEGLPLFSNLRIGARANGTQTLNGHIRSIRYFPRRLSDTELQALTA